MPKNFEKTNFTIFFILLIYINSTLKFFTKKRTHNFGILKLRILENSDWKYGSQDFKHLILCNSRITSGSVRLVSNYVVYIFYPTCFNSSLTQTLAQTYLDGKDRIINRIKTVQFLIEPIFKVRNLSSSNSISN